MGWGDFMYPVFNKQYYYRKWQHMQSNGFNWSFIVPYNNDVILALCKLNFIILLYFFVDDVIAINFDDICDFICV